MNSVSAPSRAPASPANLAISAVRSVKPRPEVCTVSSEDTVVVALTKDDGERENDLGEVMNSVSPSPPAKVGILAPRPLEFGRAQLIPKQRTAAVVGPCFGRAFAATPRGGSTNRIKSCR